MARALVGKLPKVSEMEGINCADSIRNARPDQKWPELFLYSKNDFYVKHSFIEDKVCTLSLAHLSKGPSDLEQKCTQLPTPFLGTVFHALSHCGNHFLRSVSFKNLEMEVF